MFLMGILIFKRLITRHLYKSFSVKGLKSIELRTAVIGGYTNLYNISIMHEVHLLVTTVGQDIQARNI
jgi:hypothetical protein